MQAGTHTLSLLGCDLRARTTGHQEVAPAGGPGAQGLSSGREVCTAHALSARHHAGLGHTGSGETGSLKSLVGRAE